MPAFSAVYEREGEGERERERELSEFYSKADLYLVMGGGLGAQAKTCGSWLILPIVVPGFCLKESRQAGHS